MDALGELLGGDLVERAGLADVAELEFDLLGDSGQRAGLIVAFIVSSSGVVGPSGPSGGHER